MRRAQWTCWRIAVVAIAALAVTVTPAIAGPGNGNLKDQCFTDTLCVLDNFLNEAIGDATLSFEESTYPEFKHQLVVTNHSGGFAGVRQYVKSFDMETRLAIPNFSVVPEGSQVIGLQRGKVDGQGGQVFSSMTITHAGDHLEVVGDWSSINPDSYRIDLYLGEDLVASEAGLADGTLLIEDTIDIWVIDCRTPTHLTGTIHPSPLPTATFTIPGRGSWEADNWEIMAMGFEKVATFQHEIDMLTNLPAIGIFEEVTLPAPNATDCNRNKMPDYGEIGAGLAADANDDGILDECQ